MGNIKGISKTRRYSIFNVPNIQKVGVYAIHNKKNDKYYVGSTISIANRLQLHSRDIRLHNGINCKMKDDMLSGSIPSDFEFIIIKVFNDGEITQKQLSQYERMYIKQFNAFNGYNNANFFSCANGRIKPETILYSPHGFKAVSKVYDEIKVRVPKGKKEEIKAAADSQGKSVNGFINEAIDEKMKREN